MSKALSRCIHCGESYAMAGNVCTRCDLLADRQRIDALEAYVRRYEGLVIHTGNIGPSIYCGLSFGAAPGGARTLRGALDFACVWSIENKKMGEPE